MRNGFTKREDLFRRIAEDDLRWLDTVYLAHLAVIRGGGTIFFAGNGGSAADAQHLATEYVGVGIRALSLAADSSVVTALGNDFGFEAAFARQVEALGRKGDLLVVHSTSGNSPNVVEAVEAAKRCGLVTVGLTAKGGGEVAKAVDVSVVVPTEETGLAQEVHMAIGHMIFDAVLREVVGA